MIFPKKTVARRIERAIYAGLDELSADNCDVVTLFHETWFNPWNHGRFSEKIEFAGLVSQTYFNSSRERFRFDHKVRLTTQLNFLLLVAHATDLMENICYE